MNLKEVDINLVVENNYNPNVFTGQEYNLLLNSIKEFGQVIPLLVKQEENRYIIIDGEHRLKALKELNYKKVWIIVETRAFSLNQYKKLTVYMDKARGNMQKEDIFDLFENINEENIVSFFEDLGIKPDKYNDIDINKDTFSDDFDIDIKEQEKEETVFYNVTKHEKAAINNLCEILKTNIGKVIKAEFDKNIEISDDEYFFLSWSLLQRKALLNRQLKEKTFSYLIRQKPGNIEGIIKNIIDLKNNVKL